MAAPDRFDDRRLREESLRAFVKALHTDRMVAVTGAMSTRALGYPSWDEFVKAYAIVARDLVQQIVFERIYEPGLEESPTGALLMSIWDRAQSLADRDDDKSDVDVRVSLWAIHESFRSLDQQMRRIRSGLVIDNVYQKPSLTRFERGIAAIFKSRTLGPEPLFEEPMAAAIAPLIASLGIKRVATLNYDLELERAFMLRGDEREIMRHADDEEAVERKQRATLYGEKSKAERFAAKAEEQAEKRADVEEDEVPLSSVEHFIGKRETGKPIVAVHRHRLARTMGNGVHVESDIVDRERPDRLFEFAVGSAETDRHILHLHGRADVPSSMVANIRQYDRLYRLDDLYRDPFDHSLRVLVGGNPILFVGVGMTEAELNNTLQYFVSNVPVRRPAPTFVVWNTNDSPLDEEKRRYMEDRRLDFRTRLGVHLLFDEDIVQPGDQWLSELREASRAGAPPEATLAGLYDLIDSSPGKRAEVLQAACASFNLSGDDVGGEAKRLKAMARMLTELPALVSRVDRRINRTGGWRSARTRFDTRKGKPGRILGATRVHRLIEKGGPATKAPRVDLANLRHATAHGCRSGPAKVVFAAGPLGFGRGELAEHIAQMPGSTLPIGDVSLVNTDPGERLLINAGFSYDSDAMLSGVAQFLAKGLRWPADRKICREQLFADGGLFKRPALVIINGAERFFGSDGTPLSAELDHMLRCAQRTGAVQFLLLGTERLRPYCDAIGEPLFSLPQGTMLGDANPHSAVASLPATAVAGFERWMEPTQLEKMTALAGKGVGHRYLDFVASSFAAATRAARKALVEGSPRFDAKFARADISDAAAAHIARAVSIDREALNRAFYEAFLSPALLQALDVKCPEAFEVLRTMCFIGAPVEATVLLHAPKVRAILAEDSERDHPGTEMRDREEILTRFLEVIDRLSDLGLLVELDSYLGEAGATVENASLWRRFGLHPSLASFLRDRHGAPINDAKLATAFNMSLFMSDPSDNYAPEPDFHDELGELVDSLIGGWHDSSRLYGHQRDGLLKDRVPTAEERDLLADLYIHPWDESSAWNTLMWRSSREASSCLRAALSLVRGYYSTGALLKLDRDDRIATSERDGALTEHAQRLDRLVTGFGDISVARKIVGRMKGLFASEAERVRHMGAEPFYADDLVWLHNERGVVALAQGHLFDAREAFSAADRINESEVELAPYRGHNWRRIALNRVATRIERGSLKPAERLLDEIDGTINTASWCTSDPGDGQSRPPGARVEAIRGLLRSRDKEAPIRGNAGYLREELLVVAMTTSYRGLIAYVRGRYHEAKDALETGVEMLRRLGEQRAYAHFQRHYTNLLSFGGNKVEAARQIDHAINAAQSAKQMDILHRARVVRANLTRTIQTDPTVRRHALQDIKDALHYAALSDCYRLRIEASASLARHMRHGGDYDTALRYATDALTVASRYGHSLQKTLLRIEIGQILKARGDPISGEALLTQAIAIGTSKGYHQALEHVRRARIALEANPPLPNRTDIRITA